MDYESEIKIYYYYYSTTSENRDNARASPVSEAPSVRVTRQQGLPQNRRMGINKMLYEYCWSRSVRHACFFGLNWNMTCVM